MIYQDKKKKKLCIHRVSNFPNRSSHGVNVLDSVHLHHYTRLTWANFINKLVKLHCRKKKLHILPHSYLVRTPCIQYCTLTSGIHKAQLTWTHLVPLRVGLSAPPRLGHKRHLGCTPRAQVRHSQLPCGTFRIP